MAESEPNELSLEDQLRTHLESLQAAGIEWVGRQAPPPIAPASPVFDATQFHAPLPEPTRQTLFDEPDDSDDDPRTPEERRIALATLETQVKSCTRCPELSATRNKTVFGVGPVRPDICFVGEAPGADEDRSGFPFVGAAGQLLTKIIQACGLTRDEVYICNTIKCRPPGNRVPTTTERDNCRQFFEDQIAAVKPRYLVALGGTAAQNLLRTTRSVTSLRGKFHEYRGIPLLVTYHPAALLEGRSPEKKRDVWEDMKMLLTKMGRPIPTPNKRSE
ncbi:uracil-DNA glycosylase [Tuwongella immobilis]|uniref:Type-4 uracil-DNA glycosylase n=1 Tax=Tuwongella immobilis TaxID=692036 RepID=A0A6C2YID9_9BACT|nr:uracil-DNA glycosylase [Tuwongella immobilis]VIP01029.1 DNA polymerase, bacteriophage-type OS=Blastopirellula marina DSM 3645 GN=DSM3645_10402 PE=4 SV=1: UDG [Tuwongella immobilis]VTR97483.1 DNA polymerase, bacteriophage-type OS=Blastopirellula marina DSM 3645 GN=DSM3645_10402 PE=4 SV=1: UDG [Tuwongella immobilis]